MPSIKHPDRRLRQVGEVYKTRKGPIVLMTPKEFATLKKGPKYPPIDIVHRGPKAVVIEDRREGAASVQTKTRGGEPVRLGDLLPEVLRNIRISRRRARGKR